MYPTFFPFFSEKNLMRNANRTTSRFEAHLVYKHTQKPVNTRDFTVCTTLYNYSISHMEMRGLVRMGCRQFS